MDGSNRHSWIRSLGYSYVIGEACSPFIDPMFVRVAYGVTVVYIICDTYEQADDASSQSAGRAIITTGDVLIWHILASVLIPGFTVYGIRMLADDILRSTKADSNVVKYGPTALGLLGLFILSHPIDELVDWFMDKTYRKIFD